MGLDGREGSGPDRFELGSARISSDMSFRAGQNGPLKKFGLG
jgi:hypothetical protein